MIFIEDEVVELNDRLRELVHETINKCLDYLKCDYECDISLTMVNDDDMRQINKEHRGVDKSTDVLSFPMVEWEYPCDYGYLELSYEMLKNPETGNILLGDIVLSMDKVISQANEYEHSIEREFTFLIAHSMLHLFGYDHMDDNDEKVMIQQQKEIMKTIEYL